MSCLDCPPETEVLGANPANIYWNIVRGDTAKIRMSFFESNEANQSDTSSWSYLATAYDPATKTRYSLEVNESEGYIEIIALPSVTEKWGTAATGTVAQLTFDLEITIPAVAPETEDTIWTPVIGTISVMGDVTRGVLNGS
jgi:hypothetical protein